MITWIAENLGTILVAVLLAAVDLTVIAGMVRGKKKGKSSCGCGCAQCHRKGVCRAGEKDGKQSG